MGRVTDRDRCLQGWNISYIWSCLIIDVFIWVEWSPTSTWIHGRKNFRQNMNPGFAGYSLLYFAFLTVNLPTGPYKFAMSPLCNVTDWNFNAGVRLCWRCIQFPDSQLVWILREQLINECETVLQGSLFSVNYICIAFKLVWAEDCLVPLCNPVSMCIGNFVNHTVWDHVELWRRPSKLRNEIGGAAVVRHSSQQQT